MIRAELPKGFNHSAACLRLRELNRTIVNGHLSMAVTAKGDKPYSSKSHRNLLERVVADDELPCIV
jgi:hypothetical protein